MEAYYVVFCSILIPLLFIFVSAKFKPQSTNNLPNPYPIFGHIFTILENRERYVQWTSEIVTSSPDLTFRLQGAFGRKSIITANPANVEHILKSHFHNYDKGFLFKTCLRDLLGDGIFNSDGDSWKFQRKVSSHEFNTKSLRNFIEQVVDTEISDRLVPILETAAGETAAMIDFQDILQRFAFDNICQIAFGHDPEYLSPSLPREEFSAAFETAMGLSIDRLISVTHWFWKIKRALNVGSEKRLKIAVEKIRRVAKCIIDKKRNEQAEEEDLLSRFLASGNTDEDFVADIVLSFILAGKDTTSAALTWFFWLIWKNPHAESEILREIKELKSSSALDQVKDMDYTHASLCEAMRLYPPVPVDTKAAINDDVLPDGTVVKKGTRVTYHPYAMGRVEKVWGKDWAEFKPQRWLEKTSSQQGKWSFVSRDAYTYPVFQAGPRVCLGKEMAFIQMKRVVATVLRDFKVVPVLEQGAEPEYVWFMVAKMKGGLPVMIQNRD